MVYSNTKGHYTLWLYLPRRKSTVTFFLLLFSLLICILQSCSFLIPFPLLFFLLFANIYIYFNLIKFFFKKKKSVEAGENCCRVSHSLKGWHACFFVVSKCEHSLMVLIYSTIQFKLSSQEGS